MNKRIIYHQLKKRDGLVCGICGESLKKEWEAYQIWLSVPSNKLIKRNACNLTIDHKYPKSLIRRQPDFKYEIGWWYKDVENLQLAHKTCNNLKANKV